jgi:hypothetical protein
MVMDALSPLVVEAFLVRVRVELYAAAQRLAGEDLAQLHHLLHEVVDLVDLRAAEEARAREAATETEVGQ